MSSTSAIDSERPDFYLSSHEGYESLAPRRCSRIKRLRGRERDDYLLVRIEPPIIGQRYGLGGRDIDCVLLATRHEGASLFPIREWPVFVHIARLRIEHPEDRDEVNDDELSSIMWGELYPTEEDAEGGLESFMRGPRNRTGDSPRGIWKVLRRALGF